MAEGGGEEFGAAVTGFWEEEMLERGVFFFVGLDDAVGLVDFYLGVLFSVEDVEGCWLGCGLFFCLAGLVNVVGGAGLLGFFWVCVWTVAEEFVDDGVGGIGVGGLGLGAEEEVAGSKVVDDGLDAGVLVEVVAEGAFEGGVVVSGAGEHGEVTAGGDAGDADAGGIVADFCGVGAEPADGGFEVVNLAGELGLVGEAVLDVGDGEAVRDEPVGAGVFAGALLPAATVEGDDEGGVLCEEGEVEVEVESLSVGGEVAVFFFFFGGGCSFYAGVGEVAVGGAAEVEVGEFEVVKESGVPGGGHECGGESWLVGCVADLVDFFRIILSSRF